jgi:hypothetical protein
VFGLLCRNSDALSNGIARCFPKDTQAARDQILGNFREWYRTRRPDYMTCEEWDQKVTEITGDFIDEFETRTKGDAIGKARLGSFTDLAIFTRHEDIRVVVICTDNIFRHSLENEVQNCVFEATFPAESTKLRVVCAILSSGHFDIGVIRQQSNSGSV